MLPFYFCNSSHQRKHIDLNTLATPADEGTLLAIGNLVLLRRFDERTAKFANSQES